MESIHKLDFKLTLVLIVTFILICMSSCDYITNNEIISKNHIQDMYYITVASKANERTDIAQIRISKEEYDKYKVGDDYP